MDALRCGMVAGIDAPRFKSRVSDGSSSMFCIEVSKPFFAMEAQRCGMCGVAPPRWTSGVANGSALS